jgi:hypothetical protein
MEVDEDPDVLEMINGIMLEQPEQKYELKIRKVMEWARTHSDARFPMSDIEDLINDIENDDGSLTFVLRHNKPTEEERQEIQDKILDSPMPVMALVICSANIAYWQLDEAFIRRMIEREILSLIVYFCECLTDADRDYSGGFFDRDDPLERMIELVKEILEPERPKRAKVFTTVLESYLDTEIFVLTEVPWLAGENPDGEDE